MYEWVTHMHAHLGGECSHKCKYCYVNNPRMANIPRYSGPIRLIEKEFRVRYGTGKTIFIEHMNDLFAADVPHAAILAVINHCCQYRDNTYVFQTKNPVRYWEFDKLIPQNSILGTTIETNRDIPGISNAPTPRERARVMAAIVNRRLFVTIEPVLDFDVNVLANWIAMIKPEFLNLGADSKNRNLPEPTVEKVMALVAKLHEYGIELREKHNLQRLKEK